MQVKVEGSNKRLDKVVTEILTSKGFDLTRTIVQDNISNLSKVNSNREKKSYKLKGGDIIDLDIEGWKKLAKDLDLSSKILPQKGDLDIRYEDEDLLVMYKPKGLVVHPGVGNKEDTLANYLRYYLEEKGIYDNLLDRSGIVHRLDKGVSGLMVVAKNKPTQDFLKEQFQNHNVIKIYKAKVEQFGQNNDPEFNKYRKDRDLNNILKDFDINKKVWFNWYLADGYIGRSRKNRYKMEFKKYKSGNAKRAVSYILPSENEMLIKIETGRMHQIRATLEYLGLHISGDNLYGVSKKVYESSNISLESVFLSFLKPSGERITIETYEK